MKGIIILPTFYKKYWYCGGNFNPDLVRSANAPFFYKMKDLFNFELRYADKVDVPKDTDLVFMFGVPYHNRPRLIPGLVELDKKIKLVMWPGDLQCYGNKLCEENTLKVFDRSDLILSPVGELFERLYPQYLYKYKLMPKFFSPHERYVNLKFNDSPKMRCLLSGAANLPAYPFRYYLRQQRHLIDYMPPKFKGDSYANLLHSYFCCVATSSIFNYVVSKHYEIPATGSLLLADETKDLKNVGFKPNKHYVPINRENALVVIQKCLDNPKDYEQIRKNGMKFVRKNHSINNRMKQLKTVFKEVLNN